MKNKIVKAFKIFGTYFGAVSFGIFLFCAVECCFCTTCVLGMVLAGILSLSTALSLEEDERDK